MADANRILNSVWTYDIFKNIKISKISWFFDMYHIISIYLMFSKYHLTNPLWRILERQNKFRND